MSALLIASPLLENLFFPPKPYLLSLACLFAFGAFLPSKVEAPSGLLLFAFLSSKSSSSPTSNISGSFSFVSGAFDRSTKHKSANHQKRQGINEHTSLQLLHPVEHLPLLALALLPLLDLDLLAELLEVALAARILRGPLAGRRVHQLLLHAPHVLLALHHLRKVVSWPRERRAFLLQLAARLLHRRQRLLVEGELAVQVVVHVRDCGW